MAAASAAPASPQPRSSPRPTAPSGGCGGGEVAAALRRRLAEEAARKANVQAALQRTQRAAEHHCRQLEEILGRGPPQDGGENLVRSVEDVVRSLDAEVQEAIAVERNAGGGASADDPGMAIAAPGSGYDVLRHSLELSQRRCDDLNCDMARQAEANEELVATLGTVKDTNKRLLEQIRAQTEEITRLTQQRVDDEERIEGLLRRHSQAEYMHEQEARQRLAAIREAANERLGAVEQRLTERLRCLAARARPLTEEVVALKRQRQEVLDHRAIMKDFAAHLVSSEKAIIEKVSEYLQRQDQRKEGISAEAQHLTSLLNDEADRKATEAAQRAQRQAALSIERRGVETRTGREVQLLTSQLQALKRTIQAEFDADAEDRVRYDRIAEKLAGERDERSSALDEANRELVRLESTASTIGAETRMREQSLRELRRQARESDDALAAAVSGNEHLRQQMDEHIRRSQDVMQAELSVVSSIGELKIAKANEAREAAMRAANDEVQALEMRLSDLAANAARHQTQGDALTGECEAMVADLAAVRLQYSSASSAREALEQELANARKEFAHERLKLQAAIEEIGPQNASAEAELHSLDEKFHAFKRDVLSQETELASRVGALEDLVRDAQRQLVDARTRLAETQDAVARAAADAIESERRERELQSEGEGKLERRRRELDEERRQLETQLANERHSAATSCEQSEQQCEAHANSLRQAREDCVARIAALEREKATTVEAHQEEVARTRREAQERRGRIEALERDLSRVRLLYTESQGNLKWVRQEREREQRESGTLRDRLEDERKYAAGGLSIAIEEEASAEAQLRAAQAEQAEQTRRFSREMAILRNKASTQQAQAIEQAEQLQRDVDGQARVAEARLVETVESNRVKLEALVRENEQLRSQLGASNIGGLGCGSFASQDASLRAYRCPDVAAPALGF
eukprot:TRINITY_DN27349_c0_g9_i1.p1 TRINITY_DN27349_c0_g9~~TRINITY_DN27349_c0_g9_i1.p1  ORF type:complete len:932 (+),score=257.17 TRINITY_DN27349_c0_g9_i1:60-2855(+)